MLQLITNTTAVHVILGVTKLVDKESYVSVHGTCETLSYNVKPRCCCKKREILCLNVNELESYEPDNE